MLRALYCIGNPDQRVSHTRHQFHSSVAPEIAPERVLLPTEMRRHKQAAIMVQRHVFCLTTVVTDAAAERLVHALIKPHH